MAAFVTRVLAEGLALYTLCVAVVMLLFTPFSSMVKR